MPPPPHHRWSHKGKPQRFETQLASIEPEQDPLKEQEELVEEPEHRDLRSSKDVIDFLRDNIVEGVNKAKSLGQDMKKSAPEASKAIEKAFNDILKDQKWLNKAKDIVDPILDKKEQKPEAEVQEQQEPIEKFEIFVGDDEEKLDKLMVDVKDWINEYAGLFDETEPKTLAFLNLLDELDESSEEKEVQKPRLGAAEPEEDVGGHTCTEWKELIGSLSATEFKKQYVDAMKTKTIFKVFKCFDEETVKSFEEGLTEQDWKELTPSEFAAIIASWSSSEFKEKFLDHMTKEEILYAFSEACDRITWKFIEGLTKDDWYSMTRAEWNALAEGLGSSGFKIILDGATTEELMGIFDQLDEDNIIAYYEGLTDEDWEKTTPAEWRLIGYTWESSDFKRYILDECTFEQIIYIFSNFGEDLYEKYYSGLNEQDWEKFTPAEWRAAFVTWEPSDFKKYIFDEMNEEEIEYLSQFFEDEDFDRFFAGLTEDDWESMTDAEWRAIISSFDSRDDVIEFIHFFNEKDMLWVVTEMASHATKKEIKDFYKSFSKEDYDLLSEAEWKAFKEGADEVKHFSKPWKRIQRYFSGDEKYQKERENKKANRHHRRGSNGRDHRPKHRDETKFLDWIIDEDVQMIEEMEREIEEAEMLDETYLDDPIEIVFDDEQEEDDFELTAEITWDDYVNRPVVRAHRPRVDMTTRDKMHGGRHLRGCRWGKTGGRHGEEFRGRGHHDHHNGMHGGRDPSRHIYKHMRCGILMGAFSFVAMTFVFLLCNKKSLRHRYRFEKLTEVHNTAVERNLNEEQRDELYRQVCRSNCRQRRALRRQMAAQPQEQESPRYSYIPPTEAPLMDVQPMPAPVPPQRFQQPEPQPQETMYTLEQVRQLLAMERAKYVNN